MKILIDGVLFQFDQSRIALIWESIIYMLSSFPDVSIVLADRGNAPDLAGVISVPFPAYHASYATDDSILLQKLCDFYKADIFLSTLFTTPLKTPSVQLVYEMSPERHAYDLLNRFSMEKETALSYARWFVCTSQVAKSDLVYYYPEIFDKNVSVNRLGYDRSIFRRRDAVETRYLLEEYALERPFLLVYGSGSSKKGHDSEELLLHALLKSNRCDLDVLCVGDEEKFDDSLITQIGNRFRVLRIVATDNELACAYSAARAFVCLSPFEGFGLPVVEAMACGCPIVTTKQGSLAEIAIGSAGIIVEPGSVDAIAGALLLLDDKARREAMRAAGLRECLQYNWDDIGRALYSTCRDALEDSRNEASIAFHQKWMHLRLIQSKVNTKTIFE